MNAVAAASRIDFTSCEDKDDETSRFSRKIAPLYGSNATTTATATATTTLKSEYESESSSTTPTRTFDEQQNGNGSMLRNGSPTAAVEDLDGDLDGNLQPMSVSANYRNDGGRYSITITGQRTRNTAERVLGLHKPFFSLASPVHDAISSHSVPPSIAEEMEPVHYGSLQSSYEAYSAVPNNSDQQDRASASMNPMNIILFLTNLYLRFRRLFDMKPFGSNPNSPQRRSSHDTLMNEVAPKVYYGTNQLPNGFLHVGNTPCETCLMQYEVGSAPMLNGTRDVHDSRLLPNSSNGQQAFDYTQTEPCLVCTEHLQATPTLSYLHQAHRRFVTTNEAETGGPSFPAQKRTSVRQPAVLTQDRRADLFTPRFDATSNGVYHSTVPSNGTTSLQTTFAGSETSRGRFNGSRPGPLAPATSCPPPPVKSKSIDRAPRIAQDFLYLSWPPLQRRTFGSVEDDLDDDFGLFDGLKKQSTQIEYEFNIPSRDIKFLERISQGVREAIYRGHWHGEVWVHTYWNLTHAEIKRFWEEVSRLSMIRHENVALFMGACMDPPRFAIVSTLHKNPSLYEKLHLMRDTLSQRTKVSIAKQIAQAVSYLHAKNIFVKRLRSAMVYLDPKVKLYLVNLCLDDPDGHAVIRRRDLPYIAPEILRVVRIEPHLPYVRVPDNLFTAESDAFAFGTLLYELFAGGYPFEKLEMDAFVWCMCTGKREDTERLSCSEVIRSVIQDCWAHDALCRPEVFEINALLSQPGVLKKRCSSDPERLNHLGLRNPY